MWQWNEGERQNKINFSVTFRFLNWVLLGWLFWLCGQYLILNVVGYVDKTRILPCDFDRYKNVYIRMLRWGNGEEVDRICPRKMCSENVKSKSVCHVKHHTWGIRATVSWSFNLNTIWEWVVCWLPDRISVGKEPLVPIKLKVGWAPVMVWMLWRTENSACAGNRTKISWSFSH